MSVKATFSLSETDKKEIDSLVETGHFTSKSDVVKTALRMLKEKNPEYKTDIAVTMFKEGEISLGKGAEIAGTGREEFKEILRERGIKRKIESRKGSEKRIKKVKG